MSASLHRDPTNTFVRARDDPPRTRDASRTVYACRDRKTGRPASWFVYPYDPLDTDQERTANRRADLLRSLRHPQIARYDAVWINRESGEINAICQTGPHGTLRDYRKTIASGPSSKQTRILAGDVLSALEYLHGCDPVVIYRNLRSDTVAVESPESFKLFDFSNSLRSTTDGSGAVTAIGATAYMAPEMFDVFDGSRTSYDFAADIYAFGMMLAEWDTGKRPYEECASPAQILKHCSRGTLPRIVGEVKDQGLRDVVLACASRDPQVRPSIEALAAVFASSDLSTLTSHRPTPPRTWV